MEVTVTIPDEFVGQLIPAGRDASRLRLEESVTAAYRDGRISSEEVNEILGLASKAEVDEYIKRHENSEQAIGEFRESEINPRWINDPVQARLHAIADKFVGCINNPDLPRSDNVSNALKEILLEKHERSQKTG
jgi:hypothetical protein